MWKSLRCKVPTGESGYMCFEGAYTNLMTLLLKTNDGDDLSQWVSNNGTTFRSLYSGVAQGVKKLHDISEAKKIEEGLHSSADDDEDVMCRFRLVEPRELLELLDYIGKRFTCRWGLFRPLSKPKMFYLNLLVKMEDNSLGCLICGTRTKISIHSTLEERSSPHHPFCPATWLYEDNNYEWDQQCSAHQVPVLSKFLHLMQFLRITPRPRETVWWLWLSGQLDQCKTPGATQHTLKNLLRILCHERLVMTTQRLDGGWESSEKRLFALNTIQRPKVPWCTTPKRSGEKAPVDSTADTDTATTTTYRTFQGVNVSGLCYYRLLFLQGFIVPVELPEQPDRVYACLYCGAVYRQLSFELVHPEEYFPPEQVERLFEYALYGVSDVNIIPRSMYGWQLPAVSNFEALFPTDLELADSISLEKKCSNGTLHELQNLKLALMLLSSTLDTLHKDYCVFRIKKHFTSTSTRCPICLNDFESDYKEWCTMVCGHRYCKSCYNDIRITDCGICKRGYRDEPMSISKSVMLGYLSRINEFL